MRYAESLLTEGEQIILRTRQHWLALLIRGRSAILMWILAILILVAIWAFPDVFPAQSVSLNLTGGLGLILLILGVIVFVYRLWHWWAQDYSITNRRLLKVTGILNKRSADSSLEKINDAILTQPLLGRMLGYGDLEILTAADQANDFYHMLNNPKHFKKVMLTQKHALETEFAYVGGPPPTPPLRAPAETVPQVPTAPPAPPATAAAAAAPAAAPAAVAEAPTTEAPPVDTAAAPAVPDADSTDESLEITQTLARLADLRDSGAITAEEYEQKKDELLGRL